MDQRRFALRLGIVWLVVLLGVAGGAYYLAKANFLQPRPTPDASPPINNSQPTVPSSFDPTAKWRTYTNTKYGFTVKYPPDYRVVGCKDCLDFPLATSVTFEPPDAKDFGKITISVTKERQENQTVEQYLDEIGGLTGKVVAPETRQRFELNGSEVLTISTNTGYENKHIFLVRGNRGFDIGFAGYPTGWKGLSPEDGKKVAVFGQMLSTFKVSQ